MDSKRDWKSLRRHPLAAKYGDLIGPEWDDFVENLRSHGYVDNRPIVLYEEMILDGYQRFRACRELDIEPRFEHLPEGILPREYVMMANDLRRHESPEARSDRITERRERILAKRLEGKSNRTIAEEEGVSESTVRNDLENLGAQGCAPDHVKGRDGKLYPCNRSNRFPDNYAAPIVQGQFCESSSFASDSGAQGCAPNCEPGPCDVLSQNNTCSQESLKPKIPDRLGPLFDLKPLIEEGIQQSKRLTNKLLEIEAHPAYPIVAKGKTKKQYSTYSSEIFSSLQSIIPVRPCPECGGEHEPSMENDPCMTCMDRGFQTVEEVDQ